MRRKEWGCGSVDKNYVLTLRSKACLGMYGIGIGIKREISFEAGFEKSHSYGPFPFIKHF